MRKTSVGILLGAGVGFLWGPAAGALLAQGNAVQPGVGIGVIHLGRSQAAERRDMGRPDGHYALPGGVQADYWANSDGTERTFYRHGVVVQESTPSLSEPLPGGVTMRSSLAQVRLAYPGLRRHEYSFNGGGGGGVVDYYDDARRGIAFEFTRPVGGGRPPRLYAVIVHEAGAAVIPDAGEH